MTLHTSDSSEIAELRAFLETIGANAHDRVMVLIHACIDRGICTGSAIRLVAAKLGFHPQHVLITLKEQRGTCWTRSDDGVYANLV